MTGAVDTRSIRLIDFGLAKTRYSLVDGGSAFGIGFGSDRMAEEGRDEEGEVDGEGRLEKLVDDARWGEMCADEMEEVREMLGMVLGMERCLVEIDFFVSEVGRMTDRSRSPYATG